MKFITKHLPVGGNNISSILNQELKQVAYYRYDPEYIHASDLTKPSFCKRFHVFSDKYKGKTLVSDTFNAATVVTFEQGRFLQQLLCEHWLKQLVVGDWRCRYCHTEKRFQLKPTNCIKCGHDDWKYLEIVVKNNEYGLTGSLDCLYSLGGKIIPVEVKSIDKDLFNDLKGVYAEHRLRGCLYLYLIRNSEYANLVSSDYLEVLYVSKAHGKKHVLEVSPFLSYRVNFGEVDITSYLNKALETKQARGNSNLEISRLCLSLSDKYAKKCPFVSDCFGVKK